MQFKNAVLFLSAFPAALAILPMTLELLVFQDGQRVGCVNGYGKFISSTAACYPFRTRDIEGSDNKNLWAFGYGTCSTESGVFDCYEPEGTPAIFTHNGADLELVGSGTTFSANSIPSSSDTAGAEIIVGSGGSEQFFLQVHSLSG
ncbi:NAD-dependent isocitrate dehydrogenase [Hypoxylon texense]